MGQRFTLQVRRDRSITGRPFAKKKNKSLSENAEKERTLS